MLDATLMPFLFIYSSSYAIDRVGKFHKVSSQVVQIVQQFELKSARYPYVRAYTDGGNETYERKRGASATRWQAGLILAFRTLL